MNVLIQLNGQTCAVPLDGTPVQFHGSRLACVGVDNGEGQTAPRDLASARYRRVLDCVPRAPDFVTVQTLAEMLPDMSSDTIRRMLHKAQQEKKVAVITPKRDHPGNVTRHWMLL